MISFKTLENINISAITTAFNEAFSDYLIPLQLTEEQMEIKLKSEDFAPQYSVGAFYEDKLVGFILHGYRNIDNKKLIYNGGTGVIPSQRGQHLTIKMYEFVLPILKNDGIQEVILEVLENNIQALKSYQSTGFIKTRRLKSFQGKFICKILNEQIKIKVIDSLDWEFVENFWSLQPSWQNASASIKNIIDKLIVIGAFNQNNLIGYAIYNPKSKRIQQIATSEKSRHKGVGTGLLSYISAQYGEDITLINVDENHQETIDFLIKSNFQNSINLLEMSLSL